MDIAANGLRGAEVHAGAVHGGDLAGRQRCGIGGRIGGGVQLEQMAQHVAAALSVEVEVGVIGKIRNGIRTADSTVVNMQRIVVRQREGDRHVKSAGVALLAVRKNRREFDAVFAAVVIPELLVEAAQTAVELVLALVGREVEALAVQRESRARDAVAVSADARAEIAVIFFIFLYRLIAEQHVGQNAVPVGNDNGLDRRAVGQERHAHMIAVFQRNGDRRALRAQGELLNGQHKKRPFVKSAVRLSKNTDSS